MSTLPHIRRRFLGAPLLMATALASAAVACKSSHEQPSRATPSASAPAVAAPAGSSPSVASAASARATAQGPVAERNETDEPPEFGDAGKKASELQLSGLTDIAPAGPATAHAFGVVLVTKHEDVLLARVASGKKRSAFATLDVRPEDLARFGRGPALRAGYAYWISKGRLVRRRFLAPLGPLEVLADGARSGTRVSAAPDDTPVAAVAYIAREKTGMKAKLWVEGAGTFELSPGGSAAGTVALARTSSELVSMALEGRTSMTPLHARKIHLEQNTVKLGEDVVVWVGGSAQPTTEVTALATASKLWAFIPIERDVTTFGLARVDVGTTLDMSSRVSWRVYPNGIDPSPVAAAVVCGAPRVLYVRPGSAEPHAPQELYLAEVGPAGLGPSRLLARGRVFSTVSMASGEHGTVVIAYVADHRVWGAIAPCKSL